MNFENIIISFVVSCVPAIIAYFKSTKEAKDNLKTLEKAHELQLKSLEEQTQNEIAYKLLTGELSFETIAKTVDGLNKTVKHLEKIK